MDSEQNGLSTSRIPFGSALYLASLPYRRLLYRRGGWPKAAPPEDLQDWDFLHYNFSRAQREASRHSLDRFLQLERLAGGGSGARVRPGYVTLWDPSYPADLRMIFDPPPVLFFTGKLPPPGALCYAIVGTRNAAPISLAAVPFLLEHLRDTPSPWIVSGMARGVDRQAHLSAMEMGFPGLAVLGSGVWEAGPASNLDLQRRAEDLGIPFSLLSEFPPHEGARPGHFPRRNRIIAGLVRKLFLMQAPLRSGALISASYAMEEGRDVAVFDHPLLQSSSWNEGGRKLLEEGAERIRLDHLEKRILLEPESEGLNRDGQLEFWRKRNGGKLFRLGGGWYLER